MILLLKESCASWHPSRIDFVRTSSYRSKNPEKRAVHVLEIFSRAARMPRRARRQALTATAVLGIMNLAVKLLPFRRAIVLGCLPVKTRAAAGDKEVVDEWVSAVRRVNPHLPWRSVCIHQGLALQWLLRRRGFPARLLYGTNMADGKLQAHVWVELNGEAIIGGEIADQFHLMTTYPQDPEQRNH